MTLLLTHTACLDHLTPPGHPERPDRLRAVAEEYLRYLYSEEGQDIIGRNFYRPSNSQKAQARYDRQFPRLNLFTVEQAFGGWAKADKQHFADGGSFDQIYSRK